MSILRNTQLYTGSFTSFSRSGQFFKSVQLIIGAVLAGYTAQSIPAHYMSWTAHPLGQFFIYYLLFNQSHSEKIPRMWIVIDSIIFTLIINLFLYGIKRHHEYNKEHIE